MDSSQIIIQWNARSVINKKNDIIYLLNNYKPFLFSISETWLRPSNTFRFRNYNTIREDRLDGFGGVAFLIEKNFPFHLINIPVHSPELSILAISVHNICFVSVYISHISTNILNEINNILASLPKPLIITGDFNCQHQSWGSSVSNCYGNKLLDILDVNNLCIINSGEPTRRTLPFEGKSVVDLTICSPQFVSQLTCSVLSSTFGSDHFPVITSCPFNNVNVPKQNVRLFPRYNLNNVTSETWEQFSNKVDTKLLQLLSNDALVDAPVFTDVLIESANEIFPVKNETSHIPSPPWWDKDCTEAIKKRKQAEKKYNNNMCLENYLSLKNIVNSTKLLFKRKKCDGWRNFCSSLSPNTPASEVWKKIRRFKSAYNTTHSVSLPSSIANDFLDKLAPPTVNINTNLLDKNSISDEHDESLELNSPFSKTELKNVLSYVSDSAPGPDGIYYSFISHLNDNSLTIFLKIINIIFQSGNIPLKWKCQLIIPILKTNKDPLLPSSYRPIALSSVLLKIIEHLIKNRLEWFVESNSLLSSSQFGFRRNKSTYDNIGIFTSDIRLAFSVNKFVLSAFLDLSNAYDNVIVSILRQKLLSLKIPSKIISFIINMLTDRSIIFYNNNQKYLRILTKGLPQGSVLSPLLYNLYTYDLDLAIDENVDVLQYADDLLLYIKGNNTDDASAKLTESLYYLKRWLDNHGLDLSPLKSSVVLFHRMRRAPLLHVTYDNNIIPQKNHHKFLGIILDEKLSGTPHFDFIINRCERNLNIMRCLAGVWWGAHPFYLKLIYNALIRSILDYGTFLLEPGSMSGFKALDKIQSKCLRIICGAMKSSPINALQVECCDPPLHLRRQYLADKYLFRCLQLTDHPIIAKLQQLVYFVSNSSYWTNKPNPCLVTSYFKFKSLSAPIQSSSYLPIFSCSYNALTSIPNVVNFEIEKTNSFRADEKFKRIVETRFSDYHYIFTDASKHFANSNVGVGIFHLQYNIVQKIKLPPECTVFSGECLGIFKALEYIRLAKLKKSIVFTDSLSSIQALNKNPFKIKQQHPNIFDIRQLLTECTEKGLLITFAWIPSHCGIEGNVRADTLAREAIISGDLFPYKIYYPDLLTLPKLCMDNTWQVSYDHSSRQKGMYYYSLQSEILVKPWFYNMDFNRKGCSIISRLRLGHTCSPHHLARFKITPSPSCFCGYEMGDINHLLFSCPLFDRSRFLESLIEYKIPFPTSINCLLYSRKYDVYKIVLDYIFLNNIDI